jgi:hypothetical protein
MGLYSLFITLLISISSYSSTNLELLQRLVENESHGNVVGVYKNPSTINTLSAEYRIPEFKLKPKDVLYFYVPEKFSTMSLSWLGFSHRQNSQASDSWDEYPGLTSALVYTSSMPKDKLRYWGGPSSGALGAKFAENSIYPEYDALYEWPLKGHRGVKNKKKSFELISPNVIRIQNLGTDDVYFSKLDFKVTPSPNSTFEEYIFTKNSSFGAVDSMIGRFYGGGQRLRGLYPNAIILSKDLTSKQPKLPSHYMVSRNELRIKLNPNRKFSFIQIMCGDSHPDMIINRDGGYGTSGNARMNIYLSNSITGNKRLLGKNINIPPEGVIEVSEIFEDILTLPGDEIIITNGKLKSSLYIMATRLGFLP